MWKLVLLVLNDPGRLDDVLEAWEAAGVRGATILESSGLARRRGYLGDDLPLFPSISSLMQESKSHSFTLFAVVDEAVEIPVLVERTEGVVGDLGQPNTGIFLALDLAYAKGLRAAAG